MNGAASDMLTNKMTIDFYMFGAFMKDIIMSDLNSTSIVTVKISWKTLRNTHFLKKPSKPYKLLGSIRKSMLFCFNTRSGYKRLFLTTS